MDITIENQEIWKRLAKIEKERGDAEKKCWELFEKKPNSPEFIKCDEDRRKKLEKWREFLKQNKEVLFASEVK